MRITTQMLNESARKAGIPVNNTSLLNYINNGSNTTSSLLDALDKKNAERASMEQKTNYEKLAKETETLEKAADIFSLTEENSIFTKARETGDNKEIYKSVEELVEQYNDALDALDNNTTTALNEYYRQMLAEAPADYKEALETIGITQSKDGSLNLDKDKLKEADIDTLESVLGTAADFTSKISFLARRISDNATANAESFSSQYNASGNTYSSLASKYNLWG